MGLWVYIIVILLARGARPLYVDGCTIVQTNRQEQQQLLHFTSLLITTLQSTAGLPLLPSAEAQRQREFLPTN